MFSFVLGLFCHRHSEFSFFLSLSLCRRYLRSVSFSASFFLSLTTQGSRRDQEEGGGAGPSAKKRSRTGRWSLAAKVGLLSLQVVPQQQCNGHCPCDCPARQLKQQLRSALVAGQWRGDTALTLPLCWRRSTVFQVFFGRYPRSSLHSFALFPPPPPCPRP